MWVGVTSAALLAKLSSSTDDIVWLLPFMTAKQREWNGLCYLACVQLVVTTAWVFSTAGASLLALIIPEDSTWPLSKYLELISAIMLTLYTIKLFREWCLEHYSDDDEREEDEEEGPSKETASEERVAGERCGAEAEEDEAGREAGREMPRVRRRSFGSGELGPVSALDVCLDANGSAPEGAASERRSQTGKPMPQWRSIAPPAKAEGVMATRDRIESEPLKLANDDASPAVLGRPSPVEAGAGAPAEEGPDLAAVEDVANTQSRVRDKFTPRSLVTVAILGGLDDFAVFVSVLLSGMMSPVQLGLGVFLGSLIVVSICLAAGKLACLVRVLERIPLWFIIGAIALWTFISVIFLD